MGTNAFGVGEEMNLGRMAALASTCEDMDIFGLNACGEIQSCCQPCADGIAAVVNSVVDDLLLPSYSNLTGCGGDKQCSYYMNTTARQLENIVESPSVESTISDVENSIDVAALAGQCNEDLVNDIVLCNTTSAASNFFECLNKKMGKIIAITGANDLEVERSSSSIVCGVTSIALFTIVSTFVALV